MNQYVTMSIEIIYGFFILFLLAKVLGKTQISQITTFDFISALVLGELVGNALFDKKAGILDITIVVVVWGVLMYVTELITQKFKGSRSLLEGHPSIVIRNGELNREKMKKNKLDINQLQHLLRSKGVFSVYECAYAILETDGTLSALKKSDEQTPTRRDMNLKAEKVFLPIMLINDGEFVKSNLKEANLTEDWLQGEIKAAGFKKVEDIFYAEWTTNKKLILQDGKSNLKFN